MSYQVIARKYRPQTFADLTGQEHVARTLSNALDQKRLHHAYLFSGVRGTGKTTTARILAKGLNCATGVTSRPCLQCPSCLEIATGSSLDVLEIDAASNTGVDNVREVIINNISISPARDRYKVFIIDEVHMLSNSAFNALLKTLEEPPAHVVFIMATTELHKLPDTILSRCQQFEFRHIPTEKIFRRLREIAEAEKVKVSDDALREVARAGAGSLRDAQSAFDQVIAFSGAEITEDDVTRSLGLVGAKTLAACVEALARQDNAAILGAVEELDSRGYDLRHFTRELMSYFRHLLVYKSGVTDVNRLGVTDAEAGKLKELAARFSEEDLVRFFHLTAETEKQIKDSPYPRFQLEIGLVKLTHATRLRALDEVIARLEALEASLRDGTTAPGGGAGSASPRAQTGGAKPPEPRPISPGAGGAPQRLSPPPPAEPTKPAAPPARSFTAPPVPNEPDFPPPVFEEPPGFDDYPPSEPMMPDFALPPASPPTFSRAAEMATAPAPARANGQAPRVATGREVAAIRAELERRRKNLLVAALEDAQVTFADSTLRAVFPSENAFARRLRESADLFREIGQELFGAPVKVKVDFGGAAAVLTPVDEEKLTRERLRAEATQNPAVKAILDAFRGEIIEVRDLAEQS
jgi:DNA polymerase III subunit gamma/tau